MTTFNDVFGNNTVPPSEYGFKSLNLTANTTLAWPTNADGSQVSVAKLMDVTCSAGVSVILPDARLVSTGEDFLFRNIGSNALVVKNPDGSTVGNVASGAAVYFYLRDNSAENGSYGVISYGVGTSSVDAATLIGYGIKAIESSLNVALPVTTLSGDFTIDHTYRAKVVVSTGGVMTLSLPDATVIGNDFFFLLRNSGTGTWTIDPFSSQLIDGQATMQVQPGESLLLFCSGVTWYTVGYGRSIVYNFTQLTKDVSAGGTFTLSAVEASNKLITFVGNPAADVTVVVPAVVSVYYLQSSVPTTASVLVKTSVGTGVTLAANQRIIALCDGTDVLSAQTVVSNSGLSLEDGTQALPSLNFTSSPNTGLYKSGTTGMGIAANGQQIATFDGGSIVLEEPVTFSSTTSLRIPVLKADGTTTVKVPLTNA